jgi:uncharacterized protein (TIGR00251 family)
LGFIQVTDKGTLLRLKVQPGARKNELVAVENGELKVCIAAKPHEGAANRECVKFVAKTFRVAKSGVSIIKGEKSRHKTLLLTGVGKDAIRDFRSRILAEKEK